MLEALLDLEEGVVDGVDGELGVHLVVPLDDGFVDLVYAVPSLFLAPVLATDLEQVVHIEEGRFQRIHHVVFVAFQVLLDQHSLAHKPFGLLLVFDGTVGNNELVQLLLSENTSVYELLGRGEELVCDLVAEFANYLVERVQHLQFICPVLGQEQVCFGLVSLPTQEVDVASHNQSILAELQSLHLAALSGFERYKVEEVAIAITQKRSILEVLACRTEPIFKSLDSGGVLVVSAHVHELVDGLG